ncbi:hypothetical protein DFP72DRAFT_407070 [Ephemerocybe angulata]|uniref:NACHT domain-containing protein n=1 Tax=Ephemerocybe angulata TaxID=980116 RepID=A0A8H6HV75_9AGAR|nr:hypothetical protein DFP72DRAFT_407070 [Tulosesus angulatus]
MAERRVSRTPSGKQASHTGAPQFFSNSQGFSTGDITINTPQGDYVDNSQHTTHNHYSNRPDNCDKGTILDWIDPTQVTSIQASVLRNTITERTLNTGKWFIESKPFRRFCQQKSVTLWVTALPGGGKTFLTSGAAEYIEKEFGTREDLALGIIFIQYDNPRSARDLLGALLCQMVKSSKRAENYAREFYRKRVIENREVECTKEIINELLRGAVSLLDRVFLLVDGLDEAEDPLKSALLELLVSFRVNLLLTSRPLQDVQLFYVPDSITLSVEAHKEDITLFVTERIKSSAKLTTILQGNRDLIARISARIYETCQGMFIFAQLQMDALCYLRTRNAIFESLSKPPSGLNELYRQALDRINSQPGDDAAIAKRVLIWVRHSFKPLYPSELQDAVAASQNPTAFDPGDVVPFSVAASMCCGLVTVKERNRVRFTHYTAQEYIDSVVFPEYPRPHSLLAIACINYIRFHLDVIASNSSLDDGGVWEYLSLQKLFAYTCKQWGEHARLARCEDSVDGDQGRIDSTISGFVSYLSKGSSSSGVFGSAEITGSVGELLAYGRVRQIIREHESKGDTRGPPGL